MKLSVLKALFVLLLGVMPYLGYADVPGTNSFQGYLSDDLGNPVKGTTNISFFILGTDWFEQHTAVPVKQGVFSVLLGRQMSLAAIDFSKVLQLHVEVNGISVTIPISSVPYAFHAKTVEIESDPTVPTNLKNGVSWGEIFGIPTDIADGDQVGIITESDPTVQANIWLKLLKK